MSGSSCIEPKYGTRRVCSRPGKAPHGPARHCTVLLFYKARPRRARLREAKHSSIFSHREATRSHAEHGKAQFFIFPVALPSLAPRRKAQFNISFSAELRDAWRGAAKQSSTFFGREV